MNPSLRQLGAATLLAASPALGSNPLLEPWRGPYGGVPPFDRVQVEHFAPALEAAMAAELELVGRIVSQEAEPTFQNTLLELERGGDLLDRVQAIYGVFSSTMATPDFQKVEREMAPKLAAHADRIVQNEKLFERIRKIYENRASLQPEQQRLAWLYYTGFVRAGAALDAAKKARLAEINQRLAELSTQFGQNVLGDETEQALFLKAEELDGLPEWLRASAQAAAEARGRKGEYAILNTRSAIEPFLTYSNRRDLRERAFRMFTSRGDNGDARDNNAIIAEMLALRSERAKLLGYASHAHWQIENQMAKTPERALELLEAVWKPAVARVAEEVAEMQRIADQESGQPGKIRIEPWDYRYYAEKVRKAKYDLDEDLLKPYLELEQLREGMFWVAGELFDMGFRPAQGVPVVHPDVRVWEVFRKSDGSHLGLWYFDPYAREGKRSGAWMSAYRRQYRLDGQEVTTIVSNNSNFIKAKPGEAVLISWTDAETLFHEFGHAIHGLASNVTYPSLSGTAVARDYVEFPSQILEHWLSTPEVLTRFARHYKTGEPMPQELRDRIERARTFNQGFDSVEYLASALVDMKIHLAAAQGPVDPDRFERETLQALGMPREIVMRHRLPHFLHLFSGDGYSAAYYSYLWADTLTADAWEAFLEGGGAYSKAVARRLNDHVFSVGNSIDPAEGYRAFRGRDARIDALLRKRGFPVPAGQGAKAAG